MPERVKERAFDPFFTTKEVGKGAGLGLSQIHGFAAQAGGSTEIKSEEGQGTAVAIIVPFADKPVEELDRAEVATQSLAAVKILLVEDNDQVRAFALNMLLDEGCSVMEASNAQEALTRPEEAPVDLMLTDVVMPGASGIELANHVRRTRPELPIVLVSGYSDELVGTGTDYPFVTKPFTSAKLKSVLSTALAETKLGVEARR
jgi:CheY-like chemotaxis protein